MNKGGYRKYKSTSTTFHPSIKLDLNFRHNVQMNWGELNQEGEEEEGCDEEKGKENMDF